MVARTESTCEKQTLTEADTSILGLDTNADLQRLREGVLSLLRRELRDKRLVEDLCNEAFRIVLERLREQPLEDPGKLAPYLAQTARFLARTDYRVTRRRRTFTGLQEVIEEFGDPDADPTAATQTDERAKAVRKLLEEIPHSRDREILVRVYLRDQDKEEICRELGIEETHYRRVIFRARERFRALIERRYRVSDLYGFALA
jgi:RNA polymerase sigma-70 factor, ECF subfamily